MLMMDAVFAYYRRMNKNNSFALGNNLSLIDRQDRGALASQCYRLIKNGIQLERTYSFIADGYLFF